MIFLFLPPKHKLWASWVQLLIHFFLRRQVTTFSLLFPFTHNYLCFLCMGTTRVCVLLSQLKCHFFPFPLQPFSKLQRFSRRKIINDDKNSVGREGREEGNNHIIVCAAGPERKLYQKCNNRIYKRFYLLSFSVELGGGVGWISSWNKDGGTRKQKLLFIRLPCSTTVSCKCTYVYR